MRSSVIIKGNKYGFQIVLNPTLSFEELLQEVSLKFQEASGFFDHSRPLAVSFEGRTLTEGEQNLLVDTIVEQSGLNICYIIDGAKAVESDFAKAIESIQTEEGTGPEEETMEDTQGTVTPETIIQTEKRIEKEGQFYRGTLRSGQCIEVDGSIVILGDINPGAHVIARGNVVVLGCLKGNVTAGYPEDNSAFVSALLMDPMQIKIGEFIARSPDQKTGKIRKKPRKKQPELEAKIAFVENNNIFIETITRSLISEFTMIQP